MPAEHWMTFATFSEQEFFTFPQINSYHGVILNANMVAHAPAGIAAFLLSKVPPQSAFIVDPLTHAFQHNPETISNANGPKSSIRTLAIQYGDFLANILGSRPLTPDEVVANLDVFCERVLAFQWSYLERHFSGNEYAKYLDEEEAVRRPSVLIAPYFYLTEDNLAEWLPVCRSLSAKSVELSASFERKVYSAVVVSRSILQVEATRRSVIDAYRDVGLSGVLLWVDEFDESSASSVELQGFVDLCAGLRASGLEVLNLHGGYFSCLASSPEFGGLLTGISHGPEFGESRGVVPVGGGIPISRYYVPHLHVRSKFRDFLPVALRKGWLSSPQVFYQEVCDCQQCKDVIQDDVDNFQLYGESEVKNIKRKHGVVRIEFPTTEAKKRCLKHYLWKKQKEFAFVATSSREVLLSDLDLSHEKFVGAESPQVTSHLLRWKRALEAR